ncbi:MAG: hypothetical protein U0401_20210 [Anaerolineae bacterium]
MLPCKAGWTSLAISSSYPNTGPARPPNAMRLTSIELAAVITDLDLTRLLPRNCLFWGKRHGPTGWRYICRPVSGRW